MEEVFKDAGDRRRGNEHILTSRFSNIRWYGSPNYSSTRDMWPPISTIPDSVDNDHELEITLPNGVHRKLSDDGESHNSSEEERPILPEELRECLEQLTESRDCLYHALHDGNIIRILELHPGEFDSPLSCNFQYVSLRHCHPQYEALSYVWGDKEASYYDSTTHQQIYVTHNIKCNEHEVEITPNLNRALRYIRKPSDPVTLWVDALCINQDDHQERGHQVTLMGSIYRNAGRVIIWVDQRARRPIWDFKESEEIYTPSVMHDIRAQRAFGAVCDIVNRWKVSKSQTGRARYTIQSPDVSRGVESFTKFESYPSSARNFEDQEFMAQAYKSHFPSHRSQSRYGSSFGYRRYYLADRKEEEEEEDLLSADKGINSSMEEALTSQFWYSVGDLFQRSWFWRIWIIQEAVLAKNAVVKWANAEIDWRWVGLTAAILRTSYHGICERLNIGGVYNAYLIFRISGLSDLPPPQLSFIQLLRLTRQFESTDARDRVYGLLGLKTEENDPDKGSTFLFPDYSISATELWIKLASKFIQSSQSLSILSSVQYSTERYESEHAIMNIQSRWSQSASDVLLPSWVPNWHALYRTTLNAWDTADNFAAAKNLSFTPDEDMSKAPYILNAEGVQVGTVGYLGSYMWHDVDTDFLHSKDLGQFFTSQRGFHLLARTHTAGRNSYGSLTTSADKEATGDLAAYILALHKAYERDSSRDPKYRDVDSSGLNSISYETRENKNFKAAFDMHPGFKESLETWAIQRHASRFRQTAVALCNRGRLFLTLNGFLGLAPDIAREGDILVILSGSDVPLLLRRISDGDIALGDRMESGSLGKTSQQLYLLVGECYVEGLMFGEAVEALDQQAPLAGPVPVMGVLQQIVSYGNEPEEDPNGLIYPVDRLERKRKRLEEGRLYTVEMIDREPSVQPKKNLFKIL